MFSPNTDLTVSGSSKKWVYGFDSRGSKNLSSSIKAQQKQLCPEVEVEGLGNRKLTAFGGKQNVVPM